MHQFIEMIRQELESQSAMEAYLTSSIFRNLHHSINYESDSAPVIRKAEEIDQVSESILQNIDLPENEFDTTEEVLAWQAAILRDIVQYFYVLWDEYIQHKFFAPDQFSDGEECSRLEANCEILDIDPTKTYTSILEIKHLLTDLNVKSNSILDELNNLWKLHFRSNHAEEGRAFLKKRYANELNSSEINLSLQKIKNLYDIFMEYGNKLAGANHLLWAEPARNLASLYSCLKGFIDCTYNKDPELVLDSWVDDLFPQAAYKGEVNSHRHGPLHNQIISKLSQATQCLVQFVVNENKEVFETRDRIVLEHFRKILVEKKAVLAQELNNEIEENQTNSQSAQQ